MDNLDCMPSFNELTSEKETKSDTITTLFPRTCQQLTSGAHRKTNRAWGEGTGETRWYTTRCPSRNFIHTYDGTVSSAILRLTICVIAFTFYITPVLVVMWSQLLNTIRALALDHSTIVSRLLLFVEVDTYCLTSYVFLDHEYTTVSCHK